MEQAKGKEETNLVEDEDDCDLKSMQWLISYKFPDFYSPLLDTYEDESPSASILSESFSYSSLDNSSTVWIESSSRCKSYPAGSCFTLKGKRCSAVCLLHKIIASSPDNSLSLSEIFHRFTELNPEFTRLLPRWRIELRNCLETLDCFARKTVGSEEILWMINPKCPHRLSNGIICNCSCKRLASEGLYESGNDPKRIFVGTQKAICNFGDVRCGGSNNHSQTKIQIVCQDNDRTLPKSSLIEKSNGLIAGEHCYPKRICTDQLLEKDSNLVPVPYKIVSWHRSS